MIHCCLKFRCPRTQWCRAQWGLHCVDLWLKTLCIWEQRPTLVSSPASLLFVSALELSFLASIIFSRPDILIKLNGKLLSCHRCGPPLRSQQSGETAPSRPASRGVNRRLHLLKHLRSFAHTCGFSEVAHPSKAHAQPLLDPSSEIKHVILHFQWEELCT